MEDYNDVNKECIHLNLTYAICYDAAVTQLPALSSEQAEWIVLLRKLITGYTVSGFQHALICRQVMQIIHIL